MNALLLPLAQRSNWSALGTRFSGEHLTVRTEDVVGLVLLAVFFVGGYWLLRWAATRQARGKSVHGPRRLFAELTRAHGLSYGQRRTCREAAAAIGAASPVELFVRPEGRRALGELDSELAETLFGPSPG